LMVSVLLLEDVFVEVSINNTLTFNEFSLWFGAFCIYQFLVILNQ
jgi:hypothetical protein